VATFIFFATTTASHAADAVSTRNERAGDTDLRLSSPSVASLAMPAESSASSDPTSADNTKPTKNWRLTLYPALVWAPIFGASVTEPPPPSSPPSTPSESGSTSGSLNGALFVGGRLEINQWSVETNVLWAGLSAKRENPLVKVDMDFVFGQAMAGREVVPDLFLEGGVRRLALSIGITVVNFPTLNRQPGFWDPLIGLTYRRRLSQKWTVFLHGDGGGFGVGSDVDVTATGRAEWQFTRHFGLTFGYGGFPFRQNDTSTRADLWVWHFLLMPGFWSPGASSCPS